MLRTRSDVSDAGSLITAQRQELHEQARCRDWGSQDRYRLSKAGMHGVLDVQH